MLDGVKLGEELTDQYGVPVTGEASDDADGQHARFAPTNIPHTQGFSVEVVIGWKSVDVRFTPATFAKPLLRAMASADAEKRTLFHAFVESAISAGADIAFEINGEKSNPLQPSTWAPEWSSLQLRFSKGPFEIDPANLKEQENLARGWAGKMLGCVLSLMPLEPVEAVLTGQPEGGGRQVLVTRYERSRINRAACIAIHGARCKVCGFDFEGRYGSIGAGFIEVHHVEMAARLAPGTILNPAIDLAPLCSNCHSMVHRKDPPYSLAEVAAMLRPVGWI
jgi:5-methylcytosine-specific restriction protein A